MSARELGRMVVAVTCVAFGLPPNTLGLAAVVSQARAGFARIQDLYRRGLAS